MPPTPSDALVFFGATGDLAYKKIFPSLQAMVKRGHLNVPVIGVAKAKIGKGDKRACVRMTKDSGKRCERESQCDSVCLARSGTCAPFKPMYGCNEILQDNGARVTLCLD